MRSGKKIACSRISILRLTDGSMLHKPPTHTSAWQPKSRKIDSRVHRRLHWMFMCLRLVCYSFVFRHRKEKRKMCRFVINSTPSMDAQRLAKCCANRERFQSEKANKFILIVGPLDYTTLVSPQAPSSRLPQPRYMLVYLCFRSFYQHSRIFFLFSLSNSRSTHLIYIFNLRAVEINLMNGIGKWGKEAVGGLINQTFTTEGMMTDNGNVIKWNPLDVLYCVFHKYLSREHFIWVDLEVWTINCGQAYRTSFRDSSLGETLLRANTEWSENALSQIVIFK